MAEHAMLQKMITLWNNIFAPREWRAFGDSVTRQWRMRRWQNGAWEFRDATADEAVEAQWWQANAP